MCSTEDHLKTPVTFHSDGTLGEQLDSLRETVDAHQTDPRTPSNSSSTTESGAHSRRKRFLSYPRYVELMVTADAKMVRHHGRNLEHYILTIMSVVSKILFYNTITQRNSTTHETDEKCYENVMRQGNVVSAHWYVADVWELNDYLSLVWFILYVDLSGVMWWLVMNLIQVCHAECYLT